MRYDSREAGLYGTLAASLLLVVTALSMNTPATADSGNTVDQSATGDRNFTIAGPEFRREELLIDGAPAAAAQPTPDTRLSGEVTDDGEDAFDAMLAVFEAKYPRLIRSGGKSSDASGTRFVLIPDAPTTDQIAIFKTYGMPLRVQYGTAPVTDEMRTLAGSIRLATLTGSSLVFHGYGFSPDHSGLQVLFSAAPDVAQAELEQAGKGLVDTALKSAGRALRFDVDFVEVGGPVPAQADITGGYGLTNGNFAECTSGFTAVRNGNLGVVTAKHCANGLQYRGTAGTLEFGAPASDSPEGEIDLQFHKTTGSGNTTSKKYLHYDNDERFVTNVTTQVDADRGETRCVRGAGDGHPSKTGFACAILSSDIGVCRDVGWPDGTVHYTCALVRTTNNITQTGDSGGPWFDDIPGRAVGIHTAGTSSVSYFTNINRVSLNLNATVRTN